MSANIGVSLLTTQLETKPGEQIETTVSVRNQSQIVDHFTIKVDGLDPTWWTLSIPTFSLFPETTAMPN